MNKRGQVFLMAAVIIAGLIIGISNIETDVKLGNSNEAFYDLSEEVGFETKRVLDYGVFKEENLKELLAGGSGFFRDYIDYLGNEQVVLIVGNSSNMKVHWFTEVSGNIGISTGGDAVNFDVEITDLRGRKADVSKDGESVEVVINEITYEFNLRDGENFFFVIIKHEDGEKFVAKG